MIVQEPVQAAIWHCLNHYSYSDAVFLSERLYAEVKTDDSLFLLATAYYRNGQKDHAYHVLKDNTDSSSQCRYLFGICAYDLEKYAEAEAALLHTTTTATISGGNTAADQSSSLALDAIVSEYGDQASFALALLAKIAAKTERKQRAVDAWRRALKLNPFQWTSFESLCKIGDRPDPQRVFQVADFENVSAYVGGGGLSGNTGCGGGAAGSNNANGIESLIIAQPNNNYWGGVRLETPPNNQQQDMNQQHQQQQHQQQHQDYAFITTPQQFFGSLGGGHGFMNSSSTATLSGLSTTSSSGGGGAGGGATTANSANSKFCTPDENPPQQPMWMSGFAPISSRVKSLRFRGVDSANGQDSPQPAFGQFFDNSGDTYVGTPRTIINHHHQSANNSNTTANNNNSSHHQQQPNPSLAKRMRAQVDQFINRKEPMLQNCKPVFSQSMNVTKTPTIPIQQVHPAPPPGQNVRRSSRLFSNSYSVKENNKSPSRSKFQTPKSPSRKTKQRIAKCNLNKNNSTGAGFAADLNSRNHSKSEKEKSETVTTSGKDSLKSASSDSNKSAMLITNSTASTANTVESCLHQAIQMQKQSAEGLMCLLRTMGQAYLEYAGFECRAAVETLNALPPNQFQTSWVYCVLGLCHFELTDYESSVQHFARVHHMEPHRVEFMDVYSTALWHLQREVSLSALAQDLIRLDKNSPVTWCASGNCFSLHKEHDTAIKYFQRAVQVDPNFPYAYTLLGHEYITTEELDKAMSCFRNAVRLDSRHYNAWFGIGTIYSKQERYHLAEINYQRALSINPYSSVILCHIGVVQHALKNTEKALKTLNMAIEANPKSPLCKFHRGQIYFALGRHAEALEELEELKKIVPKESVVYYLIGKVHKKLGKTDLALMHFSWATDLDPKGASNQIKEAFDPSIGRTATAIESPASPVESPASPLPEDNPTDSNSGVIQPIALSFGNLPDDSEDGF